MTHGDIMHKVYCRLIELGCTCGAPVGLTGLASLSHTQHHLSIKADVLGHLLDVAPGIRKERYSSSRVALHPACIAGVAITPLRYSGHSSVIGHLSTVHPLASRSGGERQ